MSVTTVYCATTSRREPLSSCIATTMSIADELNERPRRILGYHSPAELFDHFLDEVYAVEKCS